MISPALPSPNGSDSRGIVRCPTGTVPLGGGVIAQPPSIRANVSSSFPSGSQTRAVATCPAGTKPLGGGGTSIDSSVFVDMHSTGPHGRTWVVKENNAGPNNSGLNALALCGKVNGYRVVKGLPFTIPAAGQKAPRPCARRRPSRSAAGCSRRPRA